MGLAWTIIGLIAALLHNSDRGRVFVSEKPIQAGRLVETPPNRFCFLMKAFQCKIPDSEQDDV